MRRCSDEVAASLGATFNLDNSLLVAKASRRRAKLSQMKSETSHEGSSQLVMCRAVGLRDTKLNMNTA